MIEDQKPEHYLKHLVDITKSRVELDEQLKLDWFKREDLKSLDEFDASLERFRIAIESGVIEDMEHENICLNEQTGLLIKEILTIKVYRSIQLKKAKEQVLN